ncbi:MAG: HAD family phosphatase [Simkaniaceae bacterium]|nr:HAD family phosphatase [Simkaniaceae bacterium]
MKIDPMTYDILLFDLDGLLVNTEELHFQAYLTMLMNRGCKASFTFNDFAAIAHTSSHGLREWLSPFVPGIPWEELYQEKQAAYLKLLSKGAISLLPGVAEFLAMTSGKKRAVATNSNGTQVELIRKHCPELNVITTWVTREQYPRPKPAPDAYLTAYQQLAKSNERALGFEDSFRGIEALKSGGFDAVLICSLDHPQMGQPISVPHYPSFTKYIQSFSRR